MKGYKGENGRMRGGRQQRGGEGMTAGAEGYGAEVERADVHQRGGLE